MENFVAIDFETANCQRASVCSVGIVIVQNRKIVDQLYRLINPETDYSWQNTRIHGLRDKDTKTAPNFGMVWQELSPLIGNLPLVAHNAPFDKSCLYESCRRYELPIPNNSFHCTCQGAKRAYPSLPNHKLPTVATHCGHSLTDHHNAVADARACAEIALKVL